MLLVFLSALLTLETFSSCLIALENLQKVFGCSIKIGFVSILFGFCKVFGC